jgi:hypothetical protein
MARGGTSTCHKKVRAQFKSAEKRGIIAVTVQLGNSVWDGSMLPWADGSAQISVNKRVRTKENLSLGDTLALTVTLR